MWRYVGMVFAAALLLAAGLGTAGVRIALGQQDDHRVQICHHVEGNGNTGNGYDLITVDKDAIVNKDGQIVPNGHGTHPQDIIPAFAAGSQGSKEWGAFGGQGDASEIGNNCAPATTTTTTTTGTTTTTTTTTTGTTTTGTTTTQPTSTETTTTTTTSPPPTQPPPTTETTTTSPPETTPHKPKPPHKPPKLPPGMKPPPKNAPPGAPPICPPGGTTSVRCGPQGQG